MNAALKSREMKYQKWKHTHTQFRVCCVSFILLFTFFPFFSHSSFVVSTVYYVLLLLFMNICFLCRQYWCRLPVLCALHMASCLISSPVRFNVNVRARSFAFAHPQTPLAIFYIITNNFIRIQIAFFYASSNLMNVLFLSVWRWLRGPRLFMGTDKCAHDTTIKIEYEKLIWEKKKNETEQRNQPRKRKR